MKSRTPTPERLPQWLLGALLCLVFLTGGSSWDSEPQLMLLRPAALVCAALALFTLRAEHLRAHLAVWGLFFAATLLTVLHLVPLPFEWWSNLPSRDLVAASDRVLGLGQIARPLSVSPDATLNALMSLSVPLAVLLLAVQLKPVDHQHILALLLALVALSGLVGLLQAGGSDIALYPKQTAAGGLLANRNHQGALLAVLVPIAAALSVLGIAARLRPAARTLLIIAITIVVIPLVIVTGSRSGLVVTGIGLVFAVLIWTQGEALPSSAPKGSRLALSGVLIGLVTGLSAMTIVVSRDVALERLETAGEDLRGPVWQSIIDTLPHYMPWGTGIGSYAEVYQILEPDRLLRPTRSNHAHNEFLEVALTAGVPGLVLLALAGFALAFACWRAFGKGSAAAPAAVLARLGCTVLVLLGAASVTDYPTRTPLLAAVLALAAVWASFGTTSTGAAHSSQGST